jgi:putative ATP-dependent endonuclease of OLD family
MKIAKINISNFRGIKSAELFLPDHVVLAGDNNTGKSTVLEAIDLVLGPERLSRQPPIDEHDFYAGEYLGTEEAPICISVEIVVVGLSEEQTRYFAAHVEWWDSTANNLLEAPPAERTDAVGVVPGLRVGFKGSYDREEDNFVGRTFFLSPASEEGNLAAFKTNDKRICGFLLLRTLRTGSRALSLERGSLLDIILHLQEKRLNMWEDVLSELRKLPVAEKEELGITAILEKVQAAVRSFVPAEWAQNPHIRVSDLTREHLRKTLTVFMGTGENRADGSEYAAPFQHQGTGTINTLVLALLSMIAELKQNVIFAMEEPEIAIPPHTQRRIVDSIKKMSAQALFTSHSPYVLDEFDPKQVLLLRRTGGVLESTAAELPPTVKAKAYRTQLRTRFCECLLARRVLIAEGRTEYDALPVAARRLHELAPDRFKTVENLGLAIIDAETDTQIAPLGAFFKGLGKEVFAVCDQQTPEARAAITASVTACYESPESSFEKLVLKQAGEAALRRYAASLVAEGRWPAHLAAQTPAPGTVIRDLKDALRKFFEHYKGASEAANLLSICALDEMPVFLVTTLEGMRVQIEPPPPPPPVVEETVNPAPTAP